MVLLISILRQLENRVLRYNAKGKVIYCSQISQLKFFLNQATKKIGRFVV